jgi:hypothetical protein
MVPVLSSYSVEIGFMLGVTDHEVVRAVLLVQLVDQILRPFATTL